MPFLDTVSPAGLPPQAPEPLQTTAPAAPFDKLLEAATHQDNTLGALADYAQRRPPSPLNPAYDPFQNIKGYEDYATSFAHANSDEDVSEVKGRIDQERRRRDLLASGGVKALAAELLAGIADPVNLIPVGGEAVTVGRRGLAAAEGALRVAGAGLVSSAAQEAVLQNIQETRTLSEGAMNVAASALIGGVLGGAVGAIGAKELPNIARKVMPETETFAREFGGNLEPGSVGAAARVDTTLEQETPTSALGLEKVLKATSPTLRMAMSPSVETRRVAQALAEQPLALKKNEEGIASPISAETNMRRWQGPLASALSTADDLFVRYRLGREKRLGDMLRLGAGDVFGRNSGMMTRDEFLEAVGQAMRRGDQADIPEVAEAARLMRAKLFDPLKNDAIKLGLLPEDVAVETADSYLTRVYNLNKIAAQRPEFETRIVNWLAGLQGDAAKRLDDMRAGATAAEARKAAIGAELPGKQERLKTVGPDAVKLEKQFADIDRQLKEADKAHRKAAKTAAGTKARQEKFTPTAPLAPDDPLAELLADLRKPPKEPMRLAQFLVNYGGLKDTGGEIRQLLGSNKARPGLLNKGGKSLDEAARHAWEAGFFPDHTERPMPDDLIDALRGDLSGTPRHMESDLETADRLAHLKDVSHELEQAGIDVRQMSDAEIKAKLGGEDFRAATPANKARAREIAYQAKRDEREQARLAERVKKLQARWDELKAAHETTGKEATALKAEVAALEKELASVSGQAEKLTKKVDEQFAFSRADKLDLQDMARQITDQLVSSSPARTLYQPVPLVRGPLRERTLSIPDAMIEDFLESDVGRVAKIYTRTMAADVELARSFGRADMADQVEKVREHYAVLRNGVTDEGELLKLNKQMKADIRDIEAVRDRLRGTYGLPENPQGLAARAQRVVADFNYLRLLGGMTLSSLSDLGRPVMVHGLMRVFGQGIVPMIRDFKTYRLASDEVKLAGAALDMVLDTRAMSIADVMDDYGRWSKFERGLSGLTGKFGMVSLMAPWNAAIKQFVGVVSQTRTLEEIGNLVGGTIKGPERTRLAQLGIDGVIAARIQKMADTHGTAENNLRWANTTAWEDRAAADVFHGALSKEVDQTIVTPGQEKPLWASKSGLGKMVGQFRSFSLASVQRVTMSGLQKRDMATLNGLALMWGLGALTYFSKADHDRLEKADLGTWMKEGLDRSGALGWLFDVNNLVEKMSRNQVGASRLVGAPMTSRHASQGVLGSLLGPTAGLVEDATRTVGSAATGDWTAADTKAVRRMVPLQNLIGLKYLFDEAEHGVNRSFGIPEKAQ